MAPALAHEARAAEQAKNLGAFTVILGNPPYSGHTANAGSLIHKKLRDRLADGANSYFEVDGVGLGERQPKWLNDDYVQFIRLGQITVADRGVGAVALITNHGYLDNPTFRGMRQSLCHTYDNIAVLDLHGNTKKPEHPPDGIRDENVFDIRQGVAISMAVRLPAEHFRETAVHHGELWGSAEDKFCILLDSSIVRAHGLRWPGAGLPAMSAE
jgi:predicted helicase